MVVLISFGYFENNCMCFYLCIVVVGLFFVFNIMIGILCFIRCVVVVSFCGLVLMIMMGNVFFISFFFYLLINFDVLRFVDVLINVNMM